MTIAHQQLHGLDAAAVAALVDRVLTEQGFEGVELVWRTDQDGRLLEVTVEVPGAKSPGEGVSIDRCADLSRELSAALDASELIPHAYRLEVGSPGLDRALYLPTDYVRFSGLPARLKLVEALAGQKVLRGTLSGLDDAGNVLFEAESGEPLRLPFSQIDSARLIFDWGSAGSKPTKQPRKQPGKSSKHKQSSAPVQATAEQGLPESSGTSKSPRSE